ncbi:MAG: hypothetical protein ABIA63_11975 [bacterium]
MEKCPLKYKLDSGDNIKIQNLIGSQDLDKICEYAEGYNLIAIDEAQRIPNIGTGLKILLDQVPDIRIIAAGRFGKLANIRHLPGNNKYSEQNGQSRTID